MKVHLKINFPNFFHLKINHLKINFPHLTWSEKKREASSILLDMSIYFQRVVRRFNADADRRNRVASIPKVGDASNRFVAIDNNVPRAIYFRGGSGGSGARSRVRRNDNEDDETLLHLETRSETAQSVPFAAISTIRSDQFRVRTKRLAVPGLWSNANLFRQIGIDADFRRGWDSFSKNNRIIKSILTACSFKIFSLSLELLTDSTAQDRRSIDRRSIGE